MSRHNRNVPTAFYTRFAQDATAFAEQYARGRIVSVLEGGYSDAGLISASAAYISGLALPSRAQGIIEQRWWETDSLELVRQKPSVRSVWEILTIAYCSTAAKAHKTGHSRGETAAVQEYCAGRTSLARTHPGDN